MWIYVNVWQELTLQQDAYFIVHLDLFLNNHYYVLSLLSFVIIIYHRLLIKHNLEWNINLQRVSFSRNVLDWRIYFGKKIVVIYRYPWS